jgi:hypothetical protein
MVKYNHWRSIVHWRVANFFVLLVYSLLFLYLLCGSNPVFRDGEVIQLESENKETEVEIINVDSDTDEDKDMEEGEEDDDNDDNDDDDSDDDNDNDDDDTEDDDDIDKDNKEEEVEEGDVVGEDAAVVGDDAGVVGDDAAVIEDDAAVVGDDAAVVGDDAAVVGEDAAVVGYDAAVVGDDAAVVGGDAKDVGDRENSEKDEELVVEMEVEEQDVKKNKLEEERENGVPGSEAMEDSLPEAQAFFPFPILIVFSSVADPNPDPTDPFVFGPPGSGSGFFNHQAKVVRKTSISTVLLFCLLHVE